MKICKIIMGLFVSVSLVACASDHFPSLPDEVSIITEDGLFEEIEGINVELDIAANNSYFWSRPAGLVIAKSSRSFEATYRILVDALESNPAIKIIATLDHSANAEKVGLKLLPTREIFFGNPNLGTPLMQARQTVGIDLPQKMLIWENNQGKVFVAYNSAKYLLARHYLFGVREQLLTIANALKNFAGIATNSHINVRVSYFWLRWVAWRRGLVFVKSPHNAEETFERLQKVIEDAEPLNVLFKLEHDVNAANIGLKLRPTKLIVFGNPALGTPLIQSKRSIGLDLPQKFLVFENSRGNVYVVYNDPHFIAARHKVKGNQEQLDKIAQALANLVAGALRP